MEQVEFGPQTSIKRAISSAQDVVLSDSEISAIEKSIRDVDTFFSLEEKPLVAKYKLEVQFGKNRTSRGLPYAGVVTCWKNGNMLHGGGDEKVYECPFCSNFFGSESISGGGDCQESVSYCPKCNSTFKSVHAIGERLYKLTEQNWAHAILRVFRLLGMDADIYLKFHPTDIRYKAAMELVRDRGGEEMAKARVRRGLHIYPLKNIIKDVKHGSEIYKRIRIFINA